MKVILKYPVQVFQFDYGDIDVPEGEVIAVGFQNGIAHIWIEVDRDNINRMRLRVMPTGKEFSADNVLHHVGSAISDNYCWHIYKVYL